MRLFKRNILQIITSTLLITLGFNTLDAMIWEFYWNNWRTFAFGLWAWTPTIYMDVWLSYFLGGIIPLSIGCIILGLTLKEIYSNGN